VGKGEGAALGCRPSRAAVLVLGCGSGWAKKGKEEEGFKRKGFHFSNTFQQSIQTRV
jgi:hypothetical protein